MNVVNHLLAFFFPLVLEPGALMFQHADVGKCAAAPVVVSVSLVLPLQSPSAAARRHGAAGTGAARAPVFKHADLKNPHSSLYGVCEQQTSRSVDLLILLLDET